MPNRKKVINLLRKLNIKPKKRLGQNFVLDEDLLLQMVSCAKLLPEDTVVEIGGGLGFLSEKILDFNPKHLFIYESDKSLYNFLVKKFKDDKRVSVINSDYLKSISPPHSVNISNPPFSISSKIFLKVLRERPRIAVMTFQKEFAERLIAKPGTRKYGRLSVMASLLSTVEVVRVVKNSSFFPPPKVDVSLVKIVPKESSLTLSELKKLEVVLRELFKYRRKLLKKAINFSRISNKEVLISSFSDIVNDKRVFQLTPDELLEISRIAEIEGA